MAIGSFVEAAGVATVLCLLRFAEYGIRAPGVIEDNLSMLEDNMDMILGLTCVGAFSEVLFVCSGTVADPLPYLGASGNALIWLCAAWVEILVTVYLALRLESNEGDEDIWGLVGFKSAALIVLEVLALVTVWTFPVLMVRVKLTLRTHKHPGMQDFNGIHAISVRAQEVEGPVRLVA